MFSIIEPIETSMLKLFSDILKPYGIKTIFNYFEDEITGYIDSKIQELGYRALIEKIKSVGDEVFTMPSNVLILFQRTSPLTRDADYGLTGLPPKLNIYDNEKKVVVQKNFFPMKWTYNFVVVCKTREFEEMLEFLFYQEIQYQKFLSFIFKINEYEIPLTYKLNISEISDYGKLSEELIDNVYKFEFEIEIKGPIFSPFSLELPYIESCRTEIIAVPPKDMESPNQAIEDGRFELLGEVKCKDGLITFEDINVIQSLNFDEKNNSEN